MREYTKDIKTTLVEYLSLSGEINLSPSNCDVQQNLYQNTKSFSMAPKLKLGTNLLCIHYCSIGYWLGYTHAKGKNA